MGLLQQQPRDACSAGYLAWTCSASSTQQQYSGCCKSDPCANGGVCPSEDQQSENQNCDAGSGFQPWVCSKSYTQKEYRGCCKIDACANGGVCPASAQQPSSGTATETIATTTTPGATSSLSIDAGTSLDSASGTTTSTNAAGTTTEVQVISLTTDSGGHVSSVTVTSFSTIGPNTTGGSVISTTTSAPGPTQTSSPSSSKAAIIGGAVSGVVVLLLLLIIAIMCFRKRSKKRDSGTTDSTYGPDQGEKPSGIMGILPFRRNRNRNSMASDSSIHGRGFFSAFGKRPGALDRPDHKVSTSPVPPQGAAEMPSPSLPPPGANFDTPYDHHELESDTVTAPSELSASTPLQGYRGSGSSAWSPTPEPRSDASNTSTTAVLSPARETHYSDASSAGSAVGSRLSGSSQGGWHGQAQSQGGQSQGQSHGGHQSSLRGGGFPVMRPNLNSVRRPAPNRQLDQTQGQSSSSAQGAQAEQSQASESANGSGGVRHVLSFMEYEAEERGGGGNVHGGRRA